jgi:hypothetical protein
VSYTEPGTDLVEFDPVVFNLVGSGGAMITENVTLTVAPAVPFASGAVYGVASIVCTPMLGVHAK